MNSVLNIIFIIVALLLICNALREVFVIRDIAYTFTCKHCNTFHPKISNIDRCYNCKRSFKIKDKSWEHLILHRVNWVSSNTKSEVLIFKDYIKLSIIEITLSILGALILIINVII